MPQKQPKAWKIFKRLFNQLLLLPPPLGSAASETPLEQAPSQAPQVQAPSGTPLVPVLQSVLSQTRGANHDEWQKAARWVLNNRASLKLEPTESQWRKFRELAATLSPAVLRLLAAPGCGKTVFCLMLLHGLCQADKEQGLRRVHWMTAPTKNLVSELVEAARAILPEEWLAPLGSMPDGSERFSKHQEALALTQFKDTWDSFEAQAEEVKKLLQKVKVVHGRVCMDKEFEKAKEALGLLHLARFDWYHGDKLKEVYEQHESSVRLALCTTTYKLKHVALEKGPMRRIFKQPDVLPGGHVCDEADMVSFGPLAASLTPDQFLLAPNDPAQHMAGMHDQSRGREHNSMARTQNPNDWLKFAEKMTLLQTRRFGPRIKDLLIAMFPQDYQGLECHPEAPNTKLIVWDCGKLRLKQAIHRAGGVVDPLLLSMLGEVVDGKLQEGKPILIVCIYATMREILAAHLKDNFGASVNVVLPGGYQDANTIWVRSARQTRGSTRPIVISVFVRRNADDPDYEGHALDKGKINVCVSRSTEEQIIFAEHWDTRPYDALHRMMYHAWQKHMSGEDGYEYHTLADYDVNNRNHTKTRHDRLLQVIEWFDNAGWAKHIQYDSDDEDPSTVEFFASTDRLWDECQVIRDRQTNSWEIPRYQAVTEVDEKLWDHVKRLVVAVTVIADFQEEAPQRNLDSLITTNYLSLS